MVREVNKIASEGDKIILSGLRFYGHHGVYQEEKKLGQWFEVDVELWGDFAKAATSDNLEDTLDYCDVYNKIKRIMENGSVNLSERLAGQVLEMLLEFSRVQKALVRIKKPQASLGGPIGFAAVEMVRYKDES